MFDNFICCNNFFKQVTNCKTVGSGIKSDPSAISVKFKLNSIKLKIQKADLMVIEWQKIQTDKYYKDEFNEKLHLSLMENHLIDYIPTDSSNYTLFNQLILKSAAETANKPKSTDNGWFHFSKSTLLPSITHHDQLLHTLHTVTSIDLSPNKKALTAAKYFVTNTISLAKGTWSYYQADRIHAMKFTPKDACKVVKILVGGK